MLVILSKSVRVVTLPAPICKNILSNVDSGKTAWYTSPQDNEESNAIIWGF
ncbi:MAG: hypothetical protein FWF80_04665 [Defluviitaleaceae bacterium]|nr:hypothetical protein [Defluviitaleaceae bacterium]